MGENTNSQQKRDTEFAKFAAAQMLPWIAVAVLIIASVVFVLGFFDNSQTQRTATSGIRSQESAHVTATVRESSASPVGSHQKGAAPAHKSRETSDVKKIPGASAETLQRTQTSQPDDTTHEAESPVGHATASADRLHTTQAHRTDDTMHETESPVGHATARQTSPTRQTKPIEHSTTKAAAPKHATAPETEGHAAEPHGTTEVHEETFPVAGMAFVNAVIKPMDYELNQRFYGWRPNDIVNVTDNVNNFQLGVLEVTRRSAVILAERISRTGSTAAFDKNLENAMNWFMIKADRYWFPSPESKYRAGLKELEIYFNKLKDGKAAFYTRTDNLIPLLAAYEDLLGSCDENLVKMKENDGKPVSTFKADNYFFYAKGVASAMLTILEAIERDFNNIMVSRVGGMEVLHHAIESCHHAVEIDPWIILNSNASSIFANHRSNMAAPISHARFYLGVLIKTLST
jgi:hypothetical protein